MDEQNNQEPDKLPAESEDETIQQTFLKVFDPDISIPELQFAVPKIAYHVAKEKFKLTRNDFSFYFFTDKEYDWKIIAGVKPTILFATHPKLKDFKRALFEALHSISQVRQGKAIDLRHRLQMGESIVKIAEDKLIKDGVMVPRGDIEIEFYKVIRVKHKITGVVITHEAVEKTKSFSTMIDEARQIMARLVKVVGYVKEGRFNNPERRGLYKLNKLGD